MGVHWTFVAGEAIQCYQCSSGQDHKGEDSCGAYKKFDKSRHIAIECNSDESYTPGSFCMKITQQGPKGFICKFADNKMQDSQIDINDDRTFLVSWISLIQQS